MIALRSAWIIAAALLLTACRVPELAEPENVAWYSSRRLQLITIAPGEGAEHEDPRIFWQSAVAELTRDSRSQALARRLFDGLPISLQLLGARAPEERFRDPPPQGARFALRIRGDESAVEAADKGGLKLIQSIELGIAARGRGLDVEDREADSEDDEALARIGRLSQASDELMRLLIEDLLERRLKRWSVVEEGRSHREDLDARIAAYDARFRWMVN